jgi:hypothetical protein
MYKLKVGNRSIPGGYASKSGALKAARRLANATGKQVRVNPAAVSSAFRARLNTLTRGQLANAVEELDYPWRFPTADTFYTVAEQQAIRKAAKGGKKNPSFKVAGRDVTGRKQGYTGLVPLQMVPLDWGYRVVQDLFMWSRDRPASSLLKPVLKAAGVPRGGDRGFYAGEVLDTVYQATGHDPRVKKYARDLFDL